MASKKEKKKEPSSKERKKLSSLEIMGGAELQRMHSTVSLLNRIMIAAVGFFLVFFWILGFLGIYRLAQHSYLLLGLLILSAFFCELFLKFDIFKKTIIRTSLVCFVFQFLEITFIAIMLHLNETMPFIGALIFTIYLFVPFIGFTKRIFRITLGTYTVAIYALIVFWEYTGALVAEDMNDLGTNVSQNPRVFMMLLIVGSGVIALIAFFLEAFLARLNQSVVALQEKEKELNEARSILEVKVEAKTRQLREQAESLKKENEKKNKDLVERLSELERFRKLTVGRELKMIELKKEIEKFKKGATKNKK